MSWLFSRALVAEYSGATFLDGAYVAIVCFIAWLVYGVIALVAGGFLWPFDSDDEEIND